eukprot:TRINITY_DN9732_c0_g1_i1.p3 TRINITY_DN9732_c0_g1~~TRINITY_DN9732_c0_g1_i1.p3  ORF type:complete len:105 (-),score=8.41 TRINITY_DN9732_c0_g1_i1:229-543(-)
MQMEEKVEKMSLLGMEDWETTLRYMTASCATRGLKCLADANYPYSCPYHEYVCYCRLPRAGMWKLGRRGNERLGNYVRYFVRLVHAFDDLRKWQAAKIVHINSN